MADRYSDRPEDNMGGVSKAWEAEYAERQAPMAEWVGDVLTYLQDRYRKTTSRDTQDRILRDMQSMKG